MLAGPGEGRGTRYSLLVPRAREPIVTGKLGAPVEGPFHFPRGRSCWSRDVGEALSPCAAALPATEMERGGSRGSKDAENFDARQLTRTKRGREKKEGRSEIAAVSDPRREIQSLYVSSIDHYP